MLLYHDVLSHEYQNILGFMNYCVCPEHHVPCIFFIDLNCFCTKKHQLCNKERKQAMSNLIYICNIMDSKKISQLKVEISRYRKMKTKHVVTGPAGDNFTPMIIFVIYKCIILLMIHLYNYNCMLIVIMHLHLSYF